MIDSVEGRVFTPSTPNRLHELSNRCTAECNLVRCSACSFMPGPLNSCPTLSPHIVNIISQTSVTLTELDRLKRSLPGPSVLHHPAVQHRTRDADTLRNAFRPLRAILTRSCRINRSGDNLDRSVHRMLGCLSTTRYNVNRVRTKRPVDLSLVHRLRRLLMGNAGSSGPRTKSVQSARIFVNSPAQHVRSTHFIPVPPKRSLSVTIQSLIS